MNTMDNPTQGYRRPRSVWTGIIILCAGILLLLRRMGVDIPGWVFTWEVLFIAIGITIGIRSGFRNISSLIFIAIGALFLARHEGWIPFSLGQYIWPVAIIVVGLLIIIRPRRTYNWGAKMDNSWQQDNSGENVNSDTLDSVAIFCGTKRNVFSKNFKKGEVVNIFGGTEINFNQADINGSAVLDIVSIFGGVKIIVPAGWDVRINIVHVFAGTDDKRAIQSPPDGKKVLTLTGTAIFGGVDVRSY